MRIEIYMGKKTGKYYAEGTYEKNSVTVKKGGHINPNFAKSIRGGDTSRGYRENKEYVSSVFEILSDCHFHSPSTAAQFVSGRSVDGYNIWKVYNGQTLGEYLKEQGVR